MVYNYSFTGIHSSPKERHLQKCCVSFEKSVDTQLDWIWLWANINIETATHSLQQNAVFPHDYKKNPSTWTMRIVAQTHEAPSTTDWFISNNRIALENITWFFLRVINVRILARVPLRVMTNWLKSKTNWKFYSNTRNSVQ